MTTLKSMRIPSLLLTVCCSLVIGCSDKSDNPSSKSEAFGPPNMVASDDTDNATTSKAPDTVITNEATEDQADTKTAAQATKEKNQEAQTDHAQTKPNELIGTWSYCDDGLLSRYRFNRNNFAYIRAAFPNSNCSGVPLDGYSKIYSGSYLITGATTTAQGESVKKIDFIVSEYLGNPLGKESYEMYNIYLRGKQGLKFGDNTGSYDSFSINTRPNRLLAKQIYSVDGTAQQTARK